MIVYCDSQQLEKVFIPLEIYHIFNLQPQT